MISPHLQEICLKFRADKVKSFAHRNAERKYLLPITDDITSSSFARNQKLLDAEQEKTLFVAFHFAKYMMHKTKFDGRTKWSKIFNGLRGRLISANFRLIYRCCKMPHAVTDYESLVSAGNLALVNSVDRFDPWRGFRFSTYACNAIIRSLYRTFKRKVVIEDFLEPNDFAKPGANEGLELYLERLKFLLSTSCLTDRELKIVKGRFGLEGSARKTLGDIGNEMSLSKERIRQIETRACKKLKNALVIDQSLR